MTSIYSGAVKLQQPALNPAMCLLSSSLVELLHSCSLLHHFSWGPYQLYNALTLGLPSSITHAQTMAEGKVPAIGFICPLVMWYIDRLLVKRSGEQGMTHILCMYHSTCNRSGPLYDFYDWSQRREDYSCILFFCKTTHCIAFKVLGIHRCKSVVRQIHLIHGISSFCVHFYNVCRPRILCSSMRRCLLGLKRASCNLY